jgi:hypothetical protein
MKKINTRSLLISLIVVSVVVISGFVLKETVRMPTVYRSYSSGSITKVVLANGTELKTQEEMKPWMKGRYDTVYVR